MAASAGQSASKRSDTAQTRLPRTTAIGMAMAPGFRRALNERIPSTKPCRQTRHVRLVLHHHQRHDVTRARHVPAADTTFTSSTCGREIEPLGLSGRDSVVVMMLHFLYFRMFLFSLILLGQLAALL